jgi:putative transposase
MRPRIAFGSPSLAHMENAMLATAMRETWPHAPPHHFMPQGVYIITAATLHRKPLFDSSAKLDLLRDTTLDLAKNYALILQAWAFFSNHYHVVISFENSATSHRDFMRHLHRELAIRLNRLDCTPNRRVMYEFWDTHLTFEKSWLARLNYVHQNAVKHGLVPVANQYPWCSAAWFESNARSSFVKSVYSFRTDAINVPDDF